MHKTSIFSKVNVVNKQASLDHEISLSLEHDNDDDEHNSGINNQLKQSLLLGGEGEGNQGGELCRDANSPTFGGRLTLFGLVSRSPALVPKSPSFYVHYQYRK